MVVRQRRRAFTLMEVLMVMAVMVMFAALSYPALDSLYVGVKVEAASDSVHAAWSEAQARAVNEGRPYRFSVVPGKGNYRVAPDSSEFWSGGGAPAPDDPENPPLVLQQSMPKGIVFTREGERPGPADGETSLPDDKVPPGQWVTTAVFLPDGTAQDDVDIILHMDDARPITLHLRSLTGVISVQRGE
ncbi:MAG TPA: prepilin-type N-terminal cleavage/methylation domain-containing protein [Gemmataceae bacterium]|nr:prepilin-type N-terminal cleavage/methylation domain-containing protein [Gemmataceae bacterium]